MLKIQHSVYLFYRNLFIPVILFLTISGFSAHAGLPGKSDGSVPCYSSPASPVKFLDLPIWQLKMLGLECSQNGVFYKNQNPHWKENGNVYSILCFYLTDDVYCSNLNYHDGEKIEGDTKPVKLLKDLPMTRNGFDPVLVTDGAGKATWDAFTCLKNPAMKLIPVRINMSDLQMKKRHDWIIFWFRPTEELKSVLSGIVNIDDCLISPAEFSKSVH